MTTLIVPCAGKSSRFPGMRPKWLLTHPNGKLMIEMVLESIGYRQFDRVIVTVVLPHVEKYGADLILRQAFGKSIEVCILPDFTKSASETIYETIQKCNINDDFAIKDCDNIVECKLKFPLKNSVIGASLDNNKFEITNVGAKSFLFVNRQNIIEGIVEKKIVSDKVCLGVYCFSSVKEFCAAYEKLNSSDWESKECFISHVIQFMLSMEGSPAEFIYIAADWYEDWGTMSEWRKIQERSCCYFVDFDGVLVQNYGKYGEKNWENTLNPLEENLNRLADLQSRGAQIVITTSRSREHKDKILDLLGKYGIKPTAILCSINHAPRVLINDFAPSNPYPSARAVNLPRNGNLSEYLNG